MQIPIDTPIGFIGLLMLVIGLFLLLTGLSIVRIEKVSVTPGRSTWAIGLIFFLIGLTLVFVGEPATKPPPAEPTIELAATALALPTNTAPGASDAPVPTAASPLNPYIFLAEGSAWPLTESETFDEWVPGWTGSGASVSEHAEENMLIEDGRLLWRIKPLTGGRWFWQTVPYHSYSDFYLSFKLKRDLEAVNSTQWGIIFRKGEDGEYQFQLDDRQYFSVYLYRDQEWFPIIDWTKTNAIQPGEFNELTVIAVGPSMHFFINRQYMGSGSESTLSRGEIAYMIEVDNPGPEITFEFDDFELRVKP